MSKIRIERLIYVSSHKIVDETYHTSVSQPFEGEVISYKLIDQSKINDYPLIKRLVFRFHSSLSSKVWNAVRELYTE